MSDIAKNQVDLVEDDTAKEGVGLSDDERELQQALNNYVPGSDEEKKLLRKIDLSLMPCLWIMYILNYVDRTNIGNAKIAGMATDLKLDDSRYAWILSIFFFGYLICEVPSNMILSRSRPSIFLPSIMLVWGVLSTLMSLSNTYGAMLGFRFILGCVESGFYPGVLFLLSCWYKSNELGKRFAIFYTAAVLSGAFGGIIAGAITGNLHNSHGIPGWKWLFIVEGTATIGVSLIAYFILLDFPATSKRLSTRERQLATIRILKDGMGSGTQDKAHRLTHWQAFKAAIADPRTYAFLILFMLDVGSGTISYFIPTITKTLGYTSVKAQFMTVPIYVVAATVLNLTAYSSDKQRDRRWHITATLALGFAASVVCAAVTQPAVRYAMVCLVAAGIWSALPLILSWTSATVGLPAEKRAVVLALVNAFGNFSSVYGSRIWPGTDAPRFRVGFAVTAGFLGAAMVVAAVLPVYCRVVPWKGTRAEREVEGRQRAGRERMGVEGSDEESL